MEPSIRFLAPILGFVVAGAPALLMPYQAGLISGNEQKAAESAPISRLSPQLKEEVGPLADGAQITLDEAKSRSPYRTAIPTANDVTGERTAIWIDPTTQIAFTWETGLRFYVKPQGDVTQEEVVAGWKEKASGGEGVLLTIEGVPAIGHEKTADSPAALSFISDGLALQLVGGSQSLDELTKLAGALEYE